MVTTLSSANVRISWIAANGNGAYLTNYSIYIKLGKGSTSYIEETTYWNGATLSSQPTPYWDVPMSYLTAASPYGYLQNEVIIAKVKAYNVIGAGPEGTPNTSGIAGQLQKNNISILLSFN